MLPFPSLFEMERESGPELHKSVSDKMALELVPTMIDCSTLSCQGGAKIVKENNYPSNICLYSASGLHLDRNEDVQWAEKGHTHHLYLQTFM